MKENYINKDLILNEDPGTGRFAWRSPSNIAIVKYWGKYGVQLPSNPSISFTLSQSTTTMDLSYSFKGRKSESALVEYFFENKEANLFKEKIEKYIKSLDPIFPFLKQLELEFNSENTFPHSAGIASSASSMSALALCLCSLERELFGTLKGDEEFLKKASYVARLGSGSASRSVYPYASIWGECSVEGSSQEEAIPFHDMHESFKTYQDSILIVSSGEKPVSSSLGHKMMADHPFKEARFLNAKKNLTSIVDILKAGELDDFGVILEKEALELHGLMMNSNPSFILMSPNTLKVIERVRRFRQETKTPLYFTLDAGPNVHLLYPESDKVEVKKFIEEELSPFCEKGRVIYDHVGQGPLDL